MPFRRRDVVLAAYETESGSHYEADVVLIAAGQLNQPAVPSLPGRERFAGHSFHSARWDHDYELRGKRVAVIGNGASAVQFVPQIAGGAAHLSVFQRTANWMLPRKNHVYPRWLRARRRTPAGASVAAPPVGLLLRRVAHAGDPPSPHRRPRPGDCARRCSCAANCPTPSCVRRAWPDYTFGCKRVLFSSHYLPTLALPNVELVTDAITEITETGLRTADGRVHDVDCIIWSTGFRVTDFVAPMRVIGAAGVELADAWRDGAHAHLGMAVPGFPSLFFLYGPNTNTSGGSIIVYLEAQAAYIRQALERLRAGRHERVEVRADVEAVSDRELQARFDGTAWTACDSWYRDEQGRIVANWPGYMREYVERTHALDPDEYVFSP